MEKITDDKRLDELSLLLNILAFLFSLGAIGGSNNPVQYLIFLFTICGYYYGFVALKKENIKKYNFKPYKVIIGFIIGFLPAIMLINGAIVLFFWIFFN